VVWPSSPGAAANEVQSVTLTGAPTGGNFTLTYGGQTTAAIAFDATAAEVEGALESLSSILEGNVQVTGSAGGPWSVTFINDLGNLAIVAMTKSATGLTGGTSPNVAIAEVTPGSPGGGVWLPVPTVDAEKGVSLAFGGDFRRIRDLGSATSNRVHVLSLSIKSFTMTLTESGNDAFRFVFPNFNWDGLKLTLRAKSQEAIYHAWALETPLGVFHILKGCPMQDQELKMLISDITQPQVTVEVIEASGITGYFYPFPGLI